MKKVLLVDDDIFFRTMFSSMVSWSNYDLSLLRREMVRKPSTCYISIAISLLCLQT